jgi:uncharacterized protein
MAAFDAKPEDLPVEFPVFPLTGALLLPRGRLPLNIFEPRYKAMVEDALGGGRLFGMIQPDESRPEGIDGPALYRIGCLGRLSSFSETEDGRYLITLTGVARFSVVEEVGLRRGYRRVRGDFSTFLFDLQPVREPVDIERQRILENLRGYFTRRGFQANWDAIEQMTDEALATTLCMVCPFAAPEKQALLEAPDLAARAKALLTLLQIDSHIAPDGPEDRTPS